MRHHSYGPPDSRHQVREHPDQYGLDCIELGLEPHQLTVRFLGKAPRHFKPETVEIEGGTHIHPHVRHVHVERTPGSGDDLMYVTVDRRGDPDSLYTLHVNDERFDKRHDAVQFSFEYPGPIAHGSVHCATDNRREEVRQKNCLYGLDYVEVSADQGTLTVYFLGKAPHDLRAHSVKLLGGVRVHPKVVEVRRGTPLDGNDSIEVRVDRPGDASLYELSIDDPRFDPLFGHVEFSFKEGCPTDMDCAEDSGACAEDGAGSSNGKVSIDYRGRDYEAFRELMLDRFSITLPGWTERRPADLGIALVEVVAYVGDHLSYFQDAVGTEAYLGTARQRVSVRRHARLLGYEVSEGSNTRAFVSLHIEGAADLTLNPDDIAFETSAPGTAATLTFEPLERCAKTIYRTHNDIGIYTWGDAQCCLERGATSAVLVDTWVDAPAPAATQHHRHHETPAKIRGLALREGDLLLFEEAKGPATSLCEDASPEKRHVVRLVCPPRPFFDPLNGQALLEVHWSKEDALPFSFCLSSLTTETCEAVHDVTVARGNVLAVDHGQSGDCEDLSKVQTTSTRGPCVAEGVPGEATVAPKPFKALLGKKPLTYCEPFPECFVPASKTLIQDASRSAASIRVTEKFDGGDQADATWLPAGDLLSSGPDDRSFAIEINDSGFAGLRFGDNREGRMPEPGSGMSAVYRTGNGLAGRVAAGTEGTLVFRKNPITGVNVMVTFPVQSVGGSEPETIEAIKFRAPLALKGKRERAVTADDYSELAGQVEGVQKAGADLRWTGVNYEAHVAIDPIGRRQAGPKLLEAVEDRLLPLRRMGHDVRVSHARYVPVALTLEVCAQPASLQAQVKKAVLQALGPRGFFHPDKLTFGQSIKVSQIIAAARTVAGVESVRVSALHRYGENPDGELEAGELTIGPLEIARLDQDPVNAENGRLTVNAKGGR